MGVVALLFAATLCAAPAIDKNIYKNGPDDLLNKGQQVSTAIAAVTSTAMSPLLGVCLMGIYDYARTAPEARASLPFYSKPHFWIPIGLLLVLIFFKDTIGGTFHLLKKPLDAIEILVVNKAALVLIAFPLMYHQVSRLTGIRDIAEMLMPTVYASSGLETAEHIGSAAVLLIAGTLITLVVWVVGHAADVLALLSPIPFLDLAVKISRALVLLAIAGCAFINPTLGLIASSIVIFICALLFWMALRILILGWVFGLDVLALLILSRKRTPREGDAVRAFTVGKIQGIARQTLGTLTRDPNGILEFRYRRLGFGPMRRVRLEDSCLYDVGRGMLYPCVVLPKGEKPHIQFRLLPRYRGSEEAVRVALGMAAVRDLGFGKLMRSASA